MATPAAEVVPAATAVAETGAVAVAVGVVTRSRLWLAVLINHALTDSAQHVFRFFKKHSNPGQPHP